MRDPENVYFTIGMPRNGEIHRALMADAKKNNTKQLPQLAVIRLGDHYKLRNNGMISVLQQTSTTPEFTEDLTSNVDEADEAWPE